MGEEIHTCYHSVTALNMIAGTESGNARNKLIRKIIKFRYWYAHTNLNKNSYLIKNHYKKMFKIIKQYDIRLRK